MMLILIALTGACSAVGATGTDVCPVTEPPRPGFTPPQPWPAHPVSDEMVWFGDADLWTALDVDGDHGGRKSVWWSAAFAGGQDEPQPDITVTWHRLDTSLPDVVAGGPGTNAYTPDEGWFMIAGIDPGFGSTEPGDPGPEGCWQVTARYRDAELRYVYEAASG